VELCGEKWGKEQQLAMQTGQKTVGKKNYHGHAVRFEK
jgi:hypothetical protein